MDVKINDKSETKKEIEVTITSQEMEPFLDKTAQKAAGEMNIKGFRPGKAPRDVVENSIGKEKLYEDAAREAIQETYPKIIEENKLFTLASPQVDIIKCAPGNEVVYKATVYVLPEIKLPDYKKISQDTVKKEGKEVKIEDKEVEQALDRVRESKAKTQKVEREAREGDVVVFDFKGDFAGNEEKKVEEKDFRITLGNEEMGALKGFEDNIVGMKAGEKKSFSIKTPKLDGSSPQEKQLAGETINFEVEMKNVLEKELPEVNDEFAKTFPDVKGIDDLKEKIREGMKNEKENKEKEKVKLKVLEAIKKETSFEVPDVLVEKELDNMVKTIENQLLQSGNSFENYLKELGKSEEDLRKEWREKAKGNVSYALILHKISKDEEIKVTDEEIEEEVNRHFKAMGKEKSEEKEENLQRMRAYVSDTLKNQKVFEVLSIN